VGRYGGEEFLIIVPGCDVHSATKQAERLRESINSRTIPLAEGSIPATLSLGVAAIDQATESDFHSLLTAADAALYRAKNNGRNRVEVATASETKLGSVAVSGA